MNVLVLCTGNSARSILLESILNTVGAGRVFAYSAGSKPTGLVNPAALAQLQRVGKETVGYHSKSWNEFAAPDAPEMDIVITVCGNAANETCPIWPGTPLKAHWGVEDPAAVAGSDAEISEAFRTAYTILEHRAKALLDLPFETMAGDNLQSELTRIGGISP